MDSSTAGASFSTTLRPRHRHPAAARRDQHTRNTSSPSHSTFNEASTSLSTSLSDALRDGSTNPRDRGSSCSRTKDGQTLNNSTPNTSTPSATTWGASWASLQDIASTLLGRDASLAKGKGRAVPGRRSRQAPQSHTYGIATRGEWGPPIEQNAPLAVGSQEDRLAQLQAKRREALLTPDGHTGQDSKGKYKRRISVDQTAQTDASEADEEILVYLHHITPGDTLAGVAIKYHCPLPAFRKVNRLWPHDSIQIRKTVYLPVDACAVRGRKIAHPAGTFDLLDTLADDSTDAAPPAQSLTEAAIPSLTTSPSVTPSRPDEVQWTHDSWVLIDHFPQAVEIARLPRRALGFFPPSRRKSMAYSDLEPSPEDSKTPLLDVTRLSPYRLASPSRRSAAPPPSGSFFSIPLNGPGGVGSLDHHVRSPGPAPDKLNQLFATHLPALAPRASFDSVHSSSSTGIESMGGAIEGWVRKLATKAAAAVKTPPLRGTSGAGDLIELMEGWELDGGVEPLPSHSRAVGIGGAQEELRGRLPLRRRENAELSRKEE